MQADYAEDKTGPQYHWLQVQDGFFQLHLAKVQVGRLVTNPDVDHKAGKPEDQRQKSWQGQIQKDVGSEGQGHKGEYGRFLPCDVRKLDAPQLPGKGDLPHDECKIAKGKEEPEELKAWRVGCGNQGHAEHVPGQTAAQNLPLYLRIAAQELVAEEVSQKAHGYESNDKAGERSLPLGSCERQFHCLAQLNADAEIAKCSRQGFPLGTGKPRHRLLCIVVLPQFWELGTDLAACLFNLLHQGSRRSEGRGVAGDDGGEQKAGRIDLLHVLGSVAVLCQRNFRHAVRRTLQLLEKIVGGKLHGCSGKNDGVDEVCGNPKASAHGLKRAWIGLKLVDEHKLTIDVLFHWPDLLQHTHVGKESLAQGSGLLDDGVQHGTLACPDLAQGVVCGKFCCLLLLLGCSLVALLAQFLFLLRLGLDGLLGLGLELCSLSGLLGLLICFGGFLLGSCLAFGHARIVLGSLIGCAGNTGHCPKKDQHEQKTGKASKYPGPPKAPFCVQAVQHATHPSNRKNRRHKGCPPVPARCEAIAP